MKPTPPAPSNTLPPASYLSRDKMAEIKAALARAIVGHARRFHAYANDEYCPPSAAEEFAELEFHALNQPSGSPDHQDFTMPAECFSALPHEKLEPMLTRLQARLENDLKFYYDRKGNYTLFLPQRALPDWPEKEPSAELQCYDSALRIFQASCVAKAYHEKPFLNTGSDDRGLAADGACRLDRWFAFEDEKQATDFINTLLPLGISFTPQGERRLLN